MKLQHVVITCVDRWIHPDQLAKNKNVGIELCFPEAESGPLVRSSFHAKEQIQEWARQRNNPNSS